ncbi:bifunctional MaoC family dehydratase N-terminal/OB-fold nucleic acid binding domain-containing protein [Nonomuraea lactucae]|uniref:bifunctional MaoC family dehydratase N-terminal/OB-fold nucleic acid binding domain-containing protein n=1 Tax=Nonomuraea lactucae TaxID=2249762 RepID=UPI000DE53449|nr:bifunctional MaoC family dehydratase N-terminal/OB-fold nucleic acid binding domain-containing protein [Nonomuraea lactucae]
MTGAPATGVTTDRELRELADKQAALGEVRGVPAADPVNTPMIRHWLDAMGDSNPAYLEKGVAPPAMAQVWTMQGVRSRGRDRSPVDDVLAELDAQGFTGVVATNCEQTYHRYVRLGERLTPATRFSGLAGPKRTALGEGYFATWNVTWYGEADEPVAEMMFRVLKFRPRKRAAPGPQGGQGEGGQGEGGRRPYPLRPAVSRDTEFFWEGVRHGELRVQSCADCGRLRHPPGPVCPACRSTNRSYVTAAGEGTVYSYVVHHHPPVPGRTAPFVVAVVELPEGVRIVGNVVDCPPEAVGIGMSLRVTYRAMDDELILPLWVPRES